MDAPAKKPWTTQVAEALGFSSTPAETAAAKTFVRPEWKPLETVGDVLIEFMQRDNSEFSNPHVAKQELNIPNRFPIGHYRIHSSVSIAEESTIRSVFKEHPEAIPVILSHMRQMQEAQRPLLEQTRIEATARPHKSNGAVR